MGVPILTSEGYEADDVIGTLARQAAAAGFQVAIVTGDKDFFQLVGGAIRVYNPRTTAPGSTPTGSRRSSACCRPRSSTCSPSWATPSTT